MKAPHLGHKIPFSVSKHSTLHSVQYTVKFSFFTKSYPMPKIEIPELQLLQVDMPPC